MKNASNIALVPPYEDLIRASTSIIEHVPEDLLTLSIRPHSRRYGTLSDDEVAQSLERVLATLNLDAMVG